MWSIFINHPTKIAHLSKPSSRDSLKEVRNKLRSYDKIQVCAVSKIFLENRKVLSFLETGQGTIKTIPSTPLISFKALMDSENQSGNNEVEFESPACGTPIVTPLRSDGMDLVNLW